MPDPITDAVLAGIVTISADAIICVDESQRITFFNEGAEAIFGYSTEEIIGSPLELLIPHRFHVAHAAHIHGFAESKVRARRMGERGRISGLRKNGEEFPAEAAISQLGSEGAKVYSVVLRDITERRRAEEIQRVLAHAGETLASSLGPEDTLSNIVWLAVPTLADACIVNVYQAGKFHRAAVTHVDAARARDLQRARNEFPINLDGPHPVAEVMRSRTPLNLSSDDSDDLSHEQLAMLSDIFEGIPAASIVLPLIGREQLIGVLSLYREKRQFDKSDLFLANELARRAALAIDNARLHEEIHAGLRARDDMIGIVSHDLRNPVNAVRMLTGVILKDADEPLPGRVREYAGVIRQAAEQMDSLIRDLLDVTRVEAGRLSVDCVTVDTEELIGDALRTLAPIAEQQGLQLRLNAPDDLAPVLADRERIAQALSNLVGNAVKFAPPGSRINVRVAPLGDDEMLVSVSDAGGGMTADQLSHAFDRFWQSRRTDRQGAGLGLAITKGIIEAHGGRIWAESTVDKGSTFCFTLKLAPSVVAEL